MTGEDIIRDLGVQLNDAIAPMKEYGNRRLGLTLQDIARKQQLEDVASQRQFFTEEADRAAQRRMKEATASEQLRFANQLAMLGVTTTDENGNVLPMSQLQKNLQAYQKNRATSMLGVYSKQLQEAQSAQRDIVDRIQKIPESMGSAEQRRQSLMTTLADPTAVADIPRSELNQLQAILAKGQDPEKAVEDVFKHIQESNWFPWTRGRAQAKASRFYQSYLTNLSTRVDQNKQLALMAYSKQLDDIGTQINNIAAQRDRHVVDFAQWLPKEDINATFQSAPPEDPNAAFSGDPEFGPGPAPAAAPPPEQAPPPSPITNDPGTAFGSSAGGANFQRPIAENFGKMTKEEALRSRGLAIDANGQIQSLAGAPSPSWQTGSSMIPTPNMSGRFAPIPSPVDIQFALKVLSNPSIPWANDKWKDRKWPAPAKGFTPEGADQVEPATDQEKAAAFQLNISKYGAPADNGPLLSGLARGDQAAIKGFNLLIDEVRQRTAPAAERMPFVPGSNDNAIQNMPLAPNNPGVKATPLGAVSPTPTIVPMTFWPQ